MNYHRIEKPKSIVIMATAVADKLDDSIKRPPLMRLSAIGPSLRGPCRHCIKKLGSSRFRSFPADVTQGLSSSARLVRCWALDYVEHCGHLHVHRRMDSLCRRSLSA